MNEQAHSNAAKQHSDFKGALTTIFAMCLGGFMFVSILLELAIVSTYNNLDRVAILVGCLSVPALLLAVIHCRKWKLASFMLGVAVVAAFYILPWHPRKQFAWDLYSIKSGMNVDEANHKMSKYISGRGGKWPGSDGGLDIVDRESWTGTLTFRWNDTDWQYDSDWGQVRFENGKVVSVEFLPD